MIAVIKKKIARVNLKEFSGCFFPLLRFAFPHFTVIEELNISPGPLGSMPPNAAADIRKVSFCPNKSFLTHRARICFRLHVAHYLTFPYRFLIYKPLYIYILICSLKIALFDGAYISL